MIGATDQFRCLGVAWRVEDNLAIWKLFLPSKILTSICQQFSDELKVSRLISFLNSMY